MNRAKTLGVLLWNPSFSNIFMVYCYKFLPIALFFEKAFQYETFERKMDWLDWNMMKYPLLNFTWNWLLRAILMSNVYVLLPTNSSFAFFQLLVFGKESFLKKSTVFLHGNQLFSWFWMQVSQMSWITGLE